MITVRSEPAEAWKVPLSPNDFLSLAWEHQILIAPALG
ncbi:hypothetical protein EKH55_5541 [Sinorhizobium alkalisoli]|nr:hypothetical protein EKH55_5541 [Sinorhizobium alkalisoli]